MATKNAINNISDPISSTAVTVDPGASGDSYVQFDINSIGEFRVGVDDTDGDAFKISLGSALGTNDAFVMTADGERTMPLMPAFLAHLESTDTNVTGTSTGYTLGTGNALTIIYDQSGDFDTNGTFTTPVTGRYYFYTSMKVGDLDGAMLSSATWIITSNIIYQPGADSMGTIRNSSNEHSSQMKTFANMDLGDTATAFLIVTKGVADTADVLGQATNPISYFCGYLIA